MKRNRIVWIVVAAGNLLVILLAGCAVPAPQPAATPPVAAETPVQPAGRATAAAGELQLVYTVEECDESIPTDQLENWAKVDFTVQDSSLYIEQNLPYVCCAKVVLRLEREGNRLRIVEANEGDVCPCMCGYRIHAQVNSVPAGRYAVEVWGVESSEGAPLHLIGQKEIVIP